MVILKKTKSLFCKWAGELFCRFLINSKAIHHRIWFAICSAINNSLELAKAYAENNLQFELHIYPDAHHGVALGNNITKCGVEKYENEAIAKCVENAVFWMNSI